MTASLPKIISVDDHIVEPPTLWQDRLSSMYQDDAPKVVRTTAKLVVEGTEPQYEFGGEDGTPADVWHFGEDRVLTPRSVVSAGTPESRTHDAMTFDEMRPSCYDPVARLADMDLNGVEASICYPNTFVRFCGQRFLTTPDRGLALACVRAYNDFVVEEWCAASGGRLIPLCIVPLWDPELAATELRRNAERGVHALTFSELPTNLNLPSIHSGHWDPLFAACHETETVINVHIGSGSHFSTSSPDAPPGVGISAAFMNCALSMLDWLFSGLFIRFPNLKLCYAESQVGWLPYVLHYADNNAWASSSWTGARELLPEPPSWYFRRHIHTAFFDDPVGMELLAHVGAENVLFETDYPHGDSSYPHSLKIVEGIAATVSSEALEKIVRGNAIRLFNLAN